MGLGQRFTHSTASSMSFTPQSQNPATSSFVCGKRPSEVTHLPREDGYFERFTGKLKYKLLGRLISYTLPAVQLQAGCAAGHSCCRYCPDIAGPTKPVVQRSAAVKLRHSVSPNRRLSW